nr:UvrD-helicase domain-containing protein [Gammaproteobacteria bacterium]
MATSEAFLKGLTDKQKEVVETPSRNILVSAAAGSGKTFVLTRRVIHLLKDEGYSLDDIVVLTFTDAAAKEMKDRITKALKEFDDPRLKEELNHIDEANISTFDSFCHKFLIENIIYSNMPKNFNIGDQALFEMKEDKFLDEIINTFIDVNNVCIDGNDITNSKAFIERLHVDNVDQVKSIMKNIYKALQNKKSPLEITCNYFEKHDIRQEVENIKNSLDPILQTKIRSLKKMMTDTGYEGVDKVRELQRNYMESAELLDTVDERIAFFNAGLDVKDPITNKKPTCNWKDIPDDVQKRLKKENTKITDSFNAIKEITSYFANDNKALEETRFNHPLEMVIMGLLNNLIFKMDKFKKDYSLYTFQDIEVECIRILNEHEEIRNRYKNKIKEFLIDEYQDTNDIQSELISLISKDNVVVVGDIKQSIYRFRNANPQLFGGLKSKYEANNKLGKVIELNANFRSRDKEVLQVSNNIFKNLANDEDVNSPFFSDLMNAGNKAYTPENSSPLNEFKILEYEKDPKTKKSTEFDVIASDILNRMNSHQQVFDKDLKYIDEKTGEEKSGKFRDIEYSDILILSYASTQFGDIKSTLEQYGIPSRIIAEEEFSTSEEIIFLKNTLKMVNLLYKNEPLEGKENGKNRENFMMTLLSILRSFATKEDDNKIVDFLADEDPILTKAEKYFPELFTKLQELVETYKAYGTSVLFNELVKKFDIYRKIQSLEKKESRELKINILIQQISNYSTSGMSLDEIIDYFDYLRMNEAEVNQKLSSFDSLKCVTIMTIHKSKGLEAPVVYVAGLNRQLQPWRSLSQYSDQLGVCLKKTLKYKMQTLIETREQFIELFRLLYVAVTRPRESLTLLCIKELRDTSKDVYNFGQLMDLFHYATKFSEDIYKEITLAEKKSESDSFNEVGSPITYKNLTLEDPKKIEIKHASHDIEFEVSKEVVDYLDKGTLLHSFFEVTDFLALDFKKEIEKKKIADHFVKYLEQFKDSFLFKTPSIREFHELPYYLDGESGVIDYLLEKEKEYIIVDFKTSNIDNPAYVNQL